MSSCDPQSSAALATAPSVVPHSFDWYADPLYYDVIFEEDTPVETDMIRQVAKRFAAPHSPLARIHIGGGEAAAAAAAAATHAELAVPPSPALIRVLEPACGSGRLMLSLLEAGKSDPVEVSWSVTGFDLAPGAVRFAQQRWADMQAKEEKEAQMQAHSALPAPFTAFVADMCDFVGPLTAHMAASASSSSSSSAAASTSTLPSPSAATPPAAVVPRFDLAHCLVSSLKHLLTPAEVLGHFVQVHECLDEGGLYIVALHVHTLGGSSHFDRNVRYSHSSAAADNGDNATKTVPYVSGAEAVAVVRASMAAKADAAASTATAAAAAGARELVAPLQGTEIDDAFESEYSTPAGTKFKAELITYAPDAATMIEKMIARVHIAPSPPASEGADGSAPTPSPVPLQTDMHLRVYTLSSLHTLLCALSPWFELVEGGGCFGYADIYTEGWRADDDECALTYPYPTPTMEHIGKKKEAEAAENEQGDATHAAPPIRDPLLARSIRALSQPQRNWNRVFPVKRAVRDEWEDVEAVLVVLRRKEVEAQKEQAS